jgi:lipopolysaccharide biosynthesis glycosyltransferase
MSEKIVVTVCTANYLAQAKGLADSVIKYNPGYKVVIGLVDKLNIDFDLSIYDPHLIVQVHEINLPVFEEMHKRYNIHELNCALKSYFVRWALDKFTPQFVIYLDTDMMLFDSFEQAETLLNDFSILITPHITKPFPQDNFNPQEKDILKTGTFNAGFFGVKNDTNGNAFIDWWKERMIDKGYERPKDGLNSDQNWLNFVPLYFDKVNVVRHPGFNVAYWNLHERTISKRGNTFFSNNEPLIFFHYSGYSVAQPDKISRHQQRFYMKDNPALMEIFNIYHDTMKKNGHEKLLGMPCYYKKSSGSWLKKIGIKK